MPYANLSATLNGADKTSILTDLNDIKPLLPFLINLTKDEHRGLQSLSSGNEPFASRNDAVDFGEHTRPRVFRPAPPPVGGRLVAITNQ